MKDIINIVLENKKENYYIISGILGLCIALLFHISFFIIFLILEIYTLASINIISLMIYIFCIFILNEEKESLISKIIYFEVLLHALIVSLYIGIESGFHYYIYSLALLPFFIISKTFNIFLLRLFIIIAISIALHLYFTFFEPILHLNTNTLAYMNYFNLSSFIFAGGTIIYLYTRKLGDLKNALEVQSLYDPLTKIYNRRYAIEAYNKEINKALRTEESTSLLMIDIDFFKKVNDTYGHACGDKVIIETVMKIQEVIRPHDILSRWGGEEFLLLLPNTNKEELQIIAYRINEVIRENSITWNATSISITVTLGGSLLHKSENLLSFINRADIALYDGKNEGRDCYKLSS